MEISNIKIPNDKIKYWKDRLTYCINELLLTQELSTIYIDIDSKYFE